MTSLIQQVTNLSKELKDHNLFAKLDNFSKIILIIWINWSERYFLEFGVILMRLLFTE